MIRIVYIGKENKRRINMLYQIDDVIVDIINTDDCSSIVEKLPNDVIDLFIMSRENKCSEVCCILKNENKLQHIPVISLIESSDNIVCDSDLIVSENVSDIEFLYQIKTLIKMKLMDDELKKEKIILELKVKDRTNELENRAERLRITFNSIGDGVIVTNEIGTIISMNPIAMKICELEKTDFINNKLDDIFNVYKNNIKINIFGELSEIQNPFLSLEEVILKTKSGKELIINDSASPMINKEGNLMGIVLVFRDITDEYKMKKDLMNSEERFRNMFDNMKSAVAIYQTKDNGETFYFNGWNKRAKELESLEEKDLLGKTLDEIFPFAIESGFIDYIREVWKTGISIQVPDFFYESQDKKVKGWRSNFIYKNFVTDEIVSIYDDITESKETQESIRMSEFRLKRAELTSKSGNWELHMNTQKIIASEGARKLYGIINEDINYEDIKKNRLREYDDLLDKSMKNLVLNDIPYEVEFKIKSNTNEIIDIYSTAIYDKEKKIVYGVVQDITNRKKIEEELDKTISLVKATLESTADGILVVNYDGNVVLHNQKFMDMWNLPETVINEKEDNNLLKYAVSQLKYPNEFVDKIKYLYSDSAATSFDIIEFQDGRFFERYSIPQKINEKTVGRVWSFRDVTKKILSEKELIEAKEKAEESDKLKSEFLLSMTHEVRTPMNSILGFSSQINKDTPPNKLLDYVNVIKSSGELLITIIDDIIDLSQLQSGVFKIAKEYFNINNMLIKSEEEYNQHIILKGKDIKLILELGKFSFKTYSDSNRIKQVLNNLIINAIKFTESGSITYGYDKNDKEIIFFVKDTGRGISDKDINKIFERFYRVQSITQKKQEGTGLGLTISKAVIELLGGKIWVESEIDKGSTFYFTIPIEINDDKPIEKKKVIKKIYEWEDKKVLIVEDNMTNFRLLELFLAQTKIKVFHASNGENFYNLIKKEKYDIILLDIQLPDISGFEILEYIKKNTKIPVIIQTVYGSNEDKNKAQELGVDFYLLKPIIWDTLSKEMTRLLNL